MTKEMYAIVFNDGYIVTGSDFQDEDHAWSIALGWPTKEDIEIEKQKGTFATKGIFSYNSSEQPKTNTMTITDILQLGDDVSVDSVTLTVTKMGDCRPPRQAGWASSWLGFGEDSTGKIGLDFALKNNVIKPADYVGKSITIKAGVNRDGQSIGLKTKHNGQYRNIRISDSATVTINGAGSVAPTPATPASASRPAARTTPQQSLTAEEYAKHLATEWCQLYDWVHPIFATRVGEDKTKELTTSMFIEMNKRGITILPYTDRPFNWKDYIFKDKKLSELTEDQLKVGYVRALQGALKKPETVIAFTAAFDSLNMTMKALYGFMLNKEGIEDDSADTILLRDFKAIDQMTDEDFVKVIGSTKFFEDCKTLQASKSTPFDDETTSLD